MGVFLVGGGSAVAGILLARALDDPSPAGEIDVPEAALTGHP